jgi:hypothetical protein
MHSISVMYLNACYNDLQFAGCMQQVRAALSHKPTTLSLCTCQDTVFYIDSVIASTPFNVIRKR